MDLNFWEFKNMSHKSHGDMSGFKNQKVTNPHYKHKLIDHPNEEVKFEMEVLKRYKDPLSQLANANY